MRIPFTLLTIVFASLLAAIAPATTAADDLTLMISGKTIELSGEILIEGQDHSLLFRARDGRFWFVKPDQVKKRVDNDEPFTPFSKKEIGERLLAELPAGFRIHETKHYVIAYQNEVAYARWLGGLYEGKLYRAFESVWAQKKTKLALTDPEYPLVAIVFGSQAEFQRYVDHELGPGQSMIAYYNLETNRVAMYDLTADLGSPNQKLNDRKINQIVQNPAAIPMVATMIHEGTHQLIFNRGIQHRFAESPLWLNEGMAMYFEAPNLRSKRGWKSAGGIFQTRLIHFRNFAGRRPPNSLESLIMNDTRLSEANTSADAYSESWAFTHFLMKRKPKAFMKYLRFMSEKKTLEVDTPDTRLANFQQFFGEDMAKLDNEFIQYARKLH